MDKLTLDEVLDNELDLFARDLFNGEDFTDGGWITPTKKIIQNFTLWRARTINDEKRKYNYKYEDSNLQKSAIVNIEVGRLQDEISQLYWEQHDELLMGRSEAAYENLAKVVGKVDYLKWLFSTSGAEWKEKTFIPSFRVWIQDVLSKDSNTTESDPNYFYFEDFLRNPRPALITELKQLYSDPVEKKDIAYMMYSLSSLNELRFDPQFKISKLHPALHNFFGNIGSRQYLNWCLNDLRQLTITDSEVLQFHIYRLQSALI